MAKAKQWVFSARTTREGLKTLNELKAKLGVGWDDLVIDGMCAHYSLDKAIMALPKKKALVKVLETPPEPAKVENDKEIKWKKSSKKQQKVELSK